MTRLDLNNYPWSTRRVFLAVTALIVVACNNDLPLAPNPGNQDGSRLFSLEVQPATATIGVGGTGQFSVIGRDEAGLPLNVAVRWRVSSQAIASITDRGLVRGLRQGQVVVVATSVNPPREARATLVVRPGAGAQASGGDGVLDERPSENRFEGVIQARIQPDKALIAVGRTWQLAFFQGPRGAEQASQARWRTSDPAVVQIEDNGLLRALSPGVVTIEAASMVYEGVKAQTQVTVQAPMAKEAIRSIRVNPSALTMRVGETAWLRADITTWTGASDADVHWESGDPSVVTISDSGRVVSRSPGRTVIVASTSDTWNAASLEARVPVSVLNAYQN